MRSLLRTDHLRAWPSRLAATVVLVLHAALSGSVFLEPHGELKLGVHVEQDGARHIDQHNPESCALCEARTLTSLPSIAALPILALREVAVGPEWRLAAPVSRRALPRHSRAPPALLA